MGGQEFRGFLNLREKLLNAMSDNNVIPTVRVFLSNHPIYMVNIISAATNQNRCR
jgi:hypothetical protein